MGVRSVNIAGFVDLHWLSLYFDLLLLIANLYEEVIFETSKKWSFTIVDLLREVQLILNFL